MFFSICVRATILIDNVGRWCQKGGLANSEADTYKGLDWKLFPGFQIPPSKRDRRSHIWKRCYEIY